MPTIAIFGSSTAEPDSKSYKHAELAGEFLSKSGFDIATGGYGGIMEAALKGASLGNGGRIGVTLGFYSKRIKNRYVIEEIITFDYMDRLKKLLEISHGYVIMPGGSGTMLEFAAALALSERSRLGRKPIICIGKIWSDIYTSLYPKRELNPEINIEFTDSPEIAVSIIQKYFSKDISNIAYGTNT